MQSQEQVLSKWFAPAILAALGIYCHHITKPLQRQAYSMLSTVEKTFVCIRVYLLPGLVRSRNHHRVANCQCDEEIQDVQNLQGWTLHGPIQRGKELRGNLAKLVQKSGIWYHVCFLKRQYDKVLLLQCFY